MGDIVRLVEEAQSREAPVQRLADKVAGHFTYGVMAISAATFVFWSVFGARVLPATLHHGSAMSLVLQLSCSVLVVACPCALGLAIPTAVLLYQDLSNSKKALRCLQQVLQIDARFAKGDHLRGLLLHAMGAHKFLKRKIKVKDYDAALDLELDSMD